MRGGLGLSVSGEHSFLVSVNAEHRLACHKVCKVPYLFPHNIVKDLMVGAEKR
jgi:hypothetical protein